MRIIKNGNMISSIEDWKRFAPPKREDQWVEGRSAFELARAWCGSGIIEMPKELREILESREETSGLEVDVIIPEHRIIFDANGGEPRNADLAFVGSTANSTVAVTVEAKADEKFGNTVMETLSSSLERLMRNPHSRGVKRVEDLIRSLLAVRRKGQEEVGYLRYQLLTALAGTLAYATTQRASVAVMIVHEFVTKKTSPKKRKQNESDYYAFLERIGGEHITPDKISHLLGPFKIPGVPLFENPVPLLVGKVISWPSNV